MYFMPRKPIYMGSPSGKLWTAEMTSNRYKLFLPKRGVKRDRAPVSIGPWNKCE